MNLHGGSLGALAGTLLATASALGQTVAVSPDVLVIPKGSIFGVQVTCQGCELADLSIAATTDDSNYASVQSPSSVDALGNPFVTIFNIKGESQGGTILRIRLYQGDDDVPLSEDVSTVQVIEDFDDDCIFDDLTRHDSDRETLLSTYRQYRDEILRAGVRGHAYVNEYYRHGPELLGILARDRALRTDVLRMMREFRPSIEGVLSGRSFALSRVELAQVLDILARVNVLASPELQRTLYQVRIDLSRGKTLKEFGVTSSRTK